MKTLYLNDDEAEKLRKITKGPGRHLLNIVKEIILAHRGNFFPEVEFKPPSQPVDLFFFYSQILKSLFYIQKGNLISDVDQNKAVNELNKFICLNAIFNCDHSRKCKDFMIIFHVLLNHQQSLNQDKIDIYWMYEILSRALPDDIRLEYAFTRSNNFEYISPNELDWS